MAESDFVQFHLFGIEWNANERIALAGGRGWVVIDFGFLSGSPAVVLNDVDDLLGLVVGGGNNGG